MALYGLYVTLCYATGVSSHSIAARTHLYCSVSGDCWVLAGRMCLSLSSCSLFCRGVWAVPLISPSGKRVSACVSVCARTCVSTRVDYGPRQLYLILSDITGRELEDILKSQHQQRSRHSHESSEPRQLPQFRLSTALKHAQSMFGQGWWLCLWWVPWDIFAHLRGHLLPSRHNVH